MGKGGEGCRRGVEPGVIGKSGGGGRELVK